MAFDLSAIQKGGTQRPPLVLIHGAPEAGKTTFAAGADAPIFIRAEDGLGILDVPTFPEVETYDDVIAAITSLYGEHDFKTAVVDSLSALEPLIWDKVASDQGVKSVEDLGFGKGYIYALAYWQELVSAVQGLMRQKGMTVVLIAHSDISKFDPPDGDAYDRFNVKLQKRAAALVCEQSDIIGFAFKPIYVKKDSAKDTKGKAVSKGGRQLSVSESPAVIAKNRYAMPEKIQLEWSEFKKHVPFYNTATTNQTTEKGE